MTKTWADASGGVFGAVGLGAFAFTAVMLLRTNPVIALLLALAAWLLVAGGLYFLFRMTALFVKQDRLLMKIALSEFAAGGDCLPVDAVLEDHALVVNREVSGEATRAVAVAPIRQPLVALLDSLDFQRGKPHPRRSDGLGVSVCQPQATDRERIGRR
jgi:hypothetical protein